MKLIEGHSRDPAIISQVIEELHGEKIGLFVIDSDGDIEADFENFRQHCAPNCLLIVDDYVSEGAADKAALTKPFLDGLVDNGTVRSFGVYGWGTWVGQLISPSLLRNSWHFLRTLKKT